MELAESTADDFCADLDKVDPEQILHEQEITLSFGRYGEYFDGMLHHDAGRFHVYCNEERCGARTDGRTRFTLSHELGHFTIPEHHAALRSGVAPHHPSFCNKSNAAYYVEEEADFFASRLLMPQSRFNDAVRRSGWEGLANLRKAANVMGTSLQSTARRFMDSDEHPCAFVVWREGREPWSGVSMAFRRRGLTYLKPSAAGAVLGSATATALADDVKAVPDIRGAASVASMWFSGIPLGDRRSIGLREEAFKTAYGTITWLSAPVAELETLPLII